MRCRFHLSKFTCVISVLSFIYAIVTLSALCSYITIGHKRMKFTDMRENTVLYVSIENLSKS